MRRTRGDGAGAAVAVSEHPVPADAVAECAGELLERDMAGADALLVAAMTGFGGALREMAAALSELLGCQSHIAVASGALLVGGREADGTPALGVLAVRDRQAGVEHVAAGASPTARRGGVSSAILWDPFSVSAADVSGWDRTGPVVGGALAASDTPGGNVLVVNGSEHREGAAVLHVGSPRSRVVVSEGCAPIGPVVELTGLHGSCVTSLAGLPAAEWLEATVQAADPVVLDGAVALGLRVGGSGPMVAVRRTRAGLEPAAPLARGSLVEPVVRSAAAAVAELPTLLGDPPWGGSALLAIVDGQRPRGRGADAEAQVLSEMSLGNHLGIRCGACVHGRADGARLASGQGAAAILQFGN